MQADERAELLDWCAAWLLRALEALYREGWEEGMSLNEARSALVDVVSNLGCDAGTEDPAHVEKAKRLLAMKVKHYPPGARRRHTEKKDPRAVQVAMGRFNLAMIEKAVTRHDGAGFLRAVRAARAYLKQQGVVIDAATWLRELEEDG